MIVLRHPGKRMHSCPLELHLLPSWQRKHEDMMRQSMHILMSAKDTRDPTTTTTVKEFLCMWRDEGLGEMLEKDQVPFWFGNHVMSTEMLTALHGTPRNVKSASTSFWGRADNSYDSAQRSNRYCTCAYACTRTCTHPYFCAWIVLTTTHLATQILMMEKKGVDECSRLIQHRQVQADTHRTCSCFSGQL